MPFGAKMNKPTISRRDFLKLVNTAILSTCGILGLSGLFRFLDTSTQSPAKTDFNLGPGDKYPPGSRTVLPDVPAILLHDGSGFSALSLVCTHLGCTVEASPSGFACPCHGSKFDLGGNVTRGPAGKPLTKLRVQIASDGSLHLFTE